VSTSGDDLSVIVVGASGDLARKKVLPALFALYCQGYLPKRFTIAGFSRTELTHDAFRERIAEYLTCRYAPGESCAERMDEFLARCFYQPGRYGSRDSFLDLFQLLQEREEGRIGNRMYYLAVPPSVFLDVARAIGGAGLVECGETRPWSRIVIEKPFGRDRQTSDELVEEMAKVFTEAQTYRIDHYLGKELVQDLLVLRFANLVFEPLWNNRYVSDVLIDWKEPIGVEGRGGYFDDYGIIRDVIQNHMLQILALVAMECPVDSSAKCVRDAKVDVLRRVKTLGLADVAVGQYVAADGKGAHRPGYTEDPGIPDDSRTPTFARAALSVENERWKGVPFTITAGKAMSVRENTVRIRFRGIEKNIFCGGPGCLPPNELVIRVQPDEGITLGVMNKQPGLGLSLVESTLDLRYKAAFSAEIPDAYERLLLDVIAGDKSLFIRSDELAAAWDIFTPVLHEMEEKQVKPLPYAFGTDGPGA